MNCNHPLLQINKATKADLLLIFSERLNDDIANWQLLSLMKLLHNYFSLKCYESEFSRTSHENQVLKLK